MYGSPPASVASAPAAAASSKRGWYVGADHRVEVRRHRRAARVERFDALALRVLLSDVSAAREVVEVGLHHRHRRVGSAQRLELADLVSRLAPRLEPRPPDPARGGYGLASCVLREPPQRRGRRAAAEDAQPQARGRALLGAQVVRRARDLDGPLAIAAEVVVGGLLVLDEHAVALGRQHPRDREVRRVVALPVALRRHERRQDRALGVGVVRPVGDVGLDRAGAAVVDPLRPFTEAVEVLDRGRVEAHSERRGADGPDRRGLDRDGPRRTGPDPNLHPPAGDRARGRHDRGLHLRDEIRAVAPRRHRAGRAGPAGRRAVADRHRAALGRDHPPVGVDELERPRIRLDLRPELARPHDHDVGVRRGRQQQQRQRAEGSQRRFHLQKGGYGPGMGLLDVVKELLGDADNTTSQPSLAEITIISTGSVKTTSESQSSSAQA